MARQEPTKEQLIQELADLRRRVAELEAAEERLRENEQWARHLFETIPRGIAECTVDGVITRANSAHEAMLGYSRNELLGMNVIDLLEAGSARDAFPAYLKQLAQEQPPPSPYLCRDVTKNGEPVDVQVDWAYRRDDQGQVAGFVSVLSDITERKRAEEALERERQTLWHMYASGR